MSGVPSACARWCGSLLALTIVAPLGAGAALAQDKSQGKSPGGSQDNSEFREIETKYIFGFTEGSSIGLEGEREVSAETVMGIGKRDGRYFASQTKLEYEQTPSQFMQFEVGALVASHSIANVTGLDDRNAITCGGLFGELR